MRSTHSLLRSRCLRPLSAIAFWLVLGSSPSLQCAAGGSQPEQFGATPETAATRANQRVPGADFQPAPTPSKVDTVSRSRLVAAYGKLPLSFEANQGQTNTEVKFLSRGRGYTLFLTGHEAVLALQKAEGKTGKPEIRGETQKLEFETRNSPMVTRHSASVLRTSLVRCERGGALGQRAGKNCQARATTLSATIRRSGGPAYRITPRCDTRTFIPGSIWSITATRDRSNTTLWWRRARTPPRSSWDVAKHTSTDPRQMVISPVSLNGDEIRFSQAGDLSGPVETGLSRQQPDGGVKPLLKRQYYREGRYVLEAGNHIPSPSGRLLR